MKKNTLLKTTFCFRKMIYPRIDNWSYSSIKNYIKGFIPETDQDLFDNQCKGKKKLVMKYIRKIVKALFKEHGFEKYDEIFQDVRNLGISNYQRPSKKQYLFDTYLEKNKLSRSIRNGLLALEYIIHYNLNFDMQYSIQVEKELRKFPADCSEKTRAYFQECFDSSDRNQTERFLVESYYKKNKLFDEEDSKSCHFCFKSNLKGKNGSYRTAENVIKLAGACVGCQPKLIKPHKCPVTCEREEGTVIRSECQWCYHRSTLESQKYCLKINCKATQDQMPTVISAFNRFENLISLKGISRLRSS